MAEYTSYMGFVECTSLNISYDVMGKAAISYTVVHGTRAITPYPEYWTNGEITVGGKTFKGYIANATMNPIPRTRWFETHVTFIGVTQN